MALHTDLPIYKTGVDLLSLALDVQTQMPRTFKRSLGERVHDHCVELLNHMALANASRHAERRQHIEQLLTRLRTVTVLLRVAFDKRLLSPKLWASAVQLLDSIGKQAGGWLKKTQGHRPTSSTTHTGRDARPLPEGHGPQACAHLESGCAAAPQGHRHAHHGNSRPRAGQSGAAAPLNGHPALGAAA